MLAKGAATIPIFEIAIKGFISSGPVDTEVHNRATNDFTSNYEVGNRPKEQVGGWGIKASIVLEVHGILFARVGPVRKIIIEGIGYGELIQSYTVT